MANAGGSSLAKGGSLKASGIELRPSGVVTVHGKVAGDVIPAPGGFRATRGGRK